MLNKILSYVLVASVLANAGLAAGLTHLDGKISLVIGNPREEMQVASIPQVNADLLAGKAVLQRGR